jgi:uncharacterized protein (TIGR00725 family)
MTAPRAANRARIIGVIGGAQADPQVLAAAHEVGALLARAGCVLVCGGLGGVMEAAARGAKSQGGLTVGIIPGGTGSEANPWIDVPVATNVGYARNAIIAHTCDALIAVGGRYGTLSEIAFGLNLGKRVVSLGSWDFDQAILRATTPAEAVEKALG